MKKNSGLFSLAALLILCATLAAFLFPLGAGLARTDGSEAYQGYNFVFSNDAQGVYSPNGGMIAAFMLANPRLRGYDRLQRESLRVHARW